MERSGAGEAAEFERNTTELHEQLEQHASQLVASQLRIAALKDELEESRRRLEDEQTHEAELAQRALQLEAEAEAAGRSVADFEVDLAGSAVVTFDTPRATFLPEAAGTAAAAAAAGNTSADLTKAAAETVHLAEALASAVGEQQQQLVVQHGELASLEAEQLLQQLDAVLSSSGDSSSRPVSRSSSSRASSPVGIDMAVVRKHVEEMAKQYVKRLSAAEEELRAVKTVWQQAEQELAALRRQQGQLQQPQDVEDGRQQQQQQVEDDKDFLLVRRSPSLSDLVSPDSDAGGAAAAATASDRAAEELAADGSDSTASSTNSSSVVGELSLTGPAMHELVQLAPVNAPQHVSGSSHAAADAEHGMSGQILVELPTPVFGSSGSSSGAGRKAVPDSSVGPGPEGLVGLQGSLTEVNNDLGFNGLPRFHTDQAQQQQQQQGRQSAGSWHTPVVAAAAAATGEEGDDMFSTDEVAELQQAAEAGVKSSSANVRVRVRPIPPHPASP